MTDSTHSSSSAQSGQSPQKYNAYEDLGLSRSLSSAELSQRIDSKINGLDSTDVAELDKLQTLRSILGSQGRRGTYDAALDDPAVEELGVARLRAIAAQPDNQQASTSSTQSWDSHGAAAPQFGQSAGYSQFGQSPVMGSPAPQSVNVSLDFSAFAITEERSRSRSLMWTIGWGWIFLTWLYMLLVLLTTDFDSTAETSSGLLGMISGYEKAMDEVGKMVGTLGFVLLNTIGSLVFLQFVWNIRNYLGRRQLAR